MLLNHLEYTMIKIKAVLIGKNSRENLSNN